MSEDLGVPDMRAELERKTLETLARSIERFKREEISAHDLATILETLWGMAAGIVPLTTMDIIADARAEIGGAPPARKCEAGRKARSYAEV